MAWELCDELAMLGSRRKISAAILILGVVSLLVLLDSCSETDVPPGLTSLAAVKALIASNGRSELTIETKEFGAKVCLVPEGNVAPVFEARTVIEHDSAEFVDDDFIDQSDGYWHVATLSLDEKTVTVVSVSQSVLRWYPSDGEGHPLQNTIPICVSAIHVRLGERPVIDKLIRQGKATWEMQLLEE